MKRANGEGSIRKREDGVWEKRFCVENPTTGVIKRLSVYGKSKTEVQRKAIQAERDYLMNDGLDTQRLTVAQWLKTWQQEFIPNVKASTRSRYEQDIRKHIIPALGDIKLSKLNAILVQRFYNDEVKKGLSAKTVKGFHGVLHKALEQARKLGYVSKNVSEDCELPRVQRKKFTPVVDDKLQEFLEAIQDNVYADIIYTTIFTGMRESEAIGLTWDCIDFDKGTIHLYRQLSHIREYGKKGYYEFVSLKNNRERKFIPAKQVLLRLKSIKIKQAEWKLKAGTCWNNPDGFVFTDELGNHLCAPTVYNNFKRIVRSIGMDQTRFHDLRHTYATLALQNGTDIKTVSMTLGHATTAFTMDVYGHVSDAMLQDSSDRMSALIAEIE